LPVGLNRAFASGEQDSNRFSLATSAGNRGVRTSQSLTSDLDGVQLVRLAGGPALASLRPVTLEYDLAFGAQEAARPAP